MFSEKHCAVWLCDNQRYQCELFAFFFPIFWIISMYMVFSLASCICFFFLPLGPFLGISKIEKETTETKLECIPPYHLLTEDENRSDSVLAPVFPFPQPHIHPAPSVCYPGQGEDGYISGAIVCGLRGSAVLWGNSKIG